MRWQNDVLTELTHSLVPHQPTIRAVDITQRLVGVEPIRGDNPEVFKYRLQYDDTDESYAFAAIFYDCFEV